MSRQAPALTPRLLAGNALWNVAGSVAPLAVGIFAMRALVAALGTDRFGVLSLAWTLIGYFSLFDLGLGRALTRAVAERLGTGRFDEIPATFWTCIALLFGIGCAAATAVSLLASPIAHSILRVPPHLLSETVRSLYWIAAAVPAVTVSSGLRGFLEARQDFRGVNTVRIMIGALGFAGPWAALAFTQRLDHVVLMLVLTRFAGSVAYWRRCARYLPALAGQRRPVRMSLSPMLRFAGWITIDNIISPLMATMDRFLISSLLTISVVAYYTTPNDIVMRLLVVPAALQSVVFAAFSRMVNDAARARKLYREVTEAILLALLPAVAVAILFARDGLTLWMGSTFGSQSASTLRILAVGVLLNGVAHVPSALLQSAGRPDLNVRVHAVELPAYGALAVCLIRQFGIEGAAVAWLVRVSVDAMLFFYLGRRWMPEFPFRIPIIAVVVATLAAALLAVRLDAGLSARLLVTVAAFAFSAIASRPALQNLRRAQSE